MRPFGQSVQFIPAAGIASPFTANQLAGEIGCGWPLCRRRISPSVRGASIPRQWFQVPTGAKAGDVYTVSLANADGALDDQTQYDFETRRATVSVGYPAAPASICSDEWKINFFGSLTNPLAADLRSGWRWCAQLAGIPHRRGTTDPASYLQLNPCEWQVVNGQPQLTLQWLTAPGKAYEIQWASNPTGGPWNLLGTVGDGTIIAYQDTNATVSARFYRLHVLQ